MKRWSVDVDGDDTALWWSSGPLDPAGMPVVVSDLSIVLYGSDQAPAAHAALVAAVHDAGRLRSLAATLGSHLNATQKFTGAEVARMLLAKDPS